MKVHVEPEGVPQVTLAQAQEASFQALCKRAQRKVKRWGRWIFIVFIASWFGSVPTTPDPNTSAKSIAIQMGDVLWYKLVVYVLLSAKRAAYFCKSIAKQMKRVSPVSPYPLNLGGDNFTPKFRGQTPENTVKQGASDPPPPKFRGWNGPPFF